MNKTYPLVHLNGYMYMIDSDIRGKRGWNWIISLSRAIKLERDYEKHSAEWMFARLIVATTDKFANLPLLPEVEEDVNKLAEKEFPYQFRYNPRKKEVSDRITMQYRSIWKKGYKAASAKKYSEEDMQFMFKQGARAGLGKNETFEHSLEMLKKEPIAVEVEMREAWKIVDHTPSGDNIYQPEIWVPKTTNNIVHVVKWIYE